MKTRVVTSRKAPLPASAAHGPGQAHFQSQEEAESLSAGVFWLLCPQAPEATLTAQFGVPSWGAPVGSSKDRRSQPDPLPPPQGLRRSCPAVPVCAGPQLSCAVLSCCQSRVKAHPSPLSPCALYGRTPVRPISRNEPLAGHPGGLSWQPSSGRFPAAGGGSASALRDRAFTQPPGGLVPGVAADAGVCLVFLSSPPTLSPEVVPRWWWPCWELVTTV